MYRGRALFSSEKTDIILKIAIDWIAQGALAVKGFPSFPSPHSPAFGIVSWKEAGDNNTFKKQENDFLFYQIF